MVGHISSYYVQTSNYANLYPALTGRVDAEVCVVGGGLAGLSTALELTERGHTVALLERHRIGWGASGRTGGFLSPGYHLSPTELNDFFGPDKALELFRLSELGHSIVLERVERYGIACGPIQRGALRCAMRGSREGLEKYCDFVFEKFGLELSYWPRAQLRQVLATEAYSDAYFNPQTYSIHGLNLAQGMASAVVLNGGNVFEETRALSMEKGHGQIRIRTTDGTVHAEQLVLACGGYADTFSVAVWLATVPISTFIFVTEPMANYLTSAIDVPYAISDIAEPPNYYRPLGDGRLMWGGRDQVWEPRPRTIGARLKRDMASIYPSLGGARVESAWAGRMSFLRHSMPMIGQMEDGVWCATGFGGLGLALSALAGHLITKGIVEADDRWRLFAGFGMPFAAGPFGRFPAQIRFWREACQRRLRAAFQERTN